MVRDSVPGRVYIYGCLHCHCSSVDSSLSEPLHRFFAHPPLPVYEYICGNGPEYTSSGVTVRLTHGYEIGDTAHGHDRLSAGFYPEPINHMAARRRQEKIGRALFDDQVQVIREAYS